MTLIVPSIYNKNCNTSFQIIFEVKYLQLCIILFLNDIVLETIFLSKQLMTSLDLNL